MPSWGLIAASMSEAKNEKEQSEWIRTNRRGRGGMELSHRPPSFVCGLPRLRGVTPCMVTDPGRTGPSTWCLKPGAGPLAICVPVGLASTMRLGLTVSGLIVGSKAKKTVPRGQLETWAFLPLNVIYHMGKSLTRVEGEKLGVLEGPFWTLHVQCYPTSLPASLLDMCSLGSFSAWLREGSCTGSEKQVVILWYSKKYVSGFYPCSSRVSKILAFPKWPELAMCLLLC